MKLTSTFTKLCAALLVAALAGAATAQITKQGDGYLLRMKYKKGDVVKYTMTTTSTGANIPAMNMKMPMSNKVLSVAKGVAELEYTVGPMTNNGKAMGQAQTMKAKVDSRGKITGGGAQLQQMSNITLPEKPVKVGASWKGTQTTEAGPSGTLTLNATYTFVGVKTVSGKQVAEIKVTVSGGNQMMKTSGGGTMRLLTVDGSLYSTAMDQTITLSQGQQGINIKTKVAIVRH